MIIPNEVNKVMMKIKYCVFNKEIGKLEEKVLEIDVGELWIEDALFIEKQDDNWYAMGGPYFAGVLHKTDGLWGYINHRDETIKSLDTTLNSGTTEKLKPDFTGEI